MAEQVAVFRFSPARLLLPILGGLSLTVFFGGLALWYLPTAKYCANCRVQDPANLAILVYVLFAIVAFLTATLIPRLFQIGPVLEIADQGIRDRRIFSNFLLWTSITRISIRRIGVTRVLQVRVPKDARSKLDLTLVGRFFYFGSWDFSIGMSGLNGAFDDLLRAVKQASGRDIEGG